jgi:hypothetical protein
MDTWAHKIIHLLHNSSSSATAENASCHTPGSVVLVQDIALICQNHWQVAHALLEAQDVMKAAIAVTKKESDNGTAQKMWCQCRKLQFFLSWSLAHWEVIERLSNRIETWIAEWKLPSANDSDVEMLASELQILETCTNKWQDENQWYPVLFEEMESRMI